MRGTGQVPIPLLLLFLFLSFLPSLAAQAIPYTRPVETAPQAQTIGGGYQTPAVQKPLPRDSWLQMLDVVMLAAAMGISVWLVLKRRNRKWAIVLTIGSLAYFGFYPSRDHSDPSRARFYPGRDRSYPSRERFYPSRERSDRSRDREGAVA